MEADVGVPWTKVRRELWDDEITHRIADALLADSLAPLVAALGESEARAVAIDRAGAGCCRVWNWAAGESEDGNAPVTLLSRIDHAARIPGFGNAMLAAGWLEPCGEGYTYPQWEAHISMSARKRALASVRVSRFRNARVTPKKRAARDQDGDGIKDPPKPPKGGGEKAQRVAAAAPPAGKNGAEPSGDADPLTAAVRHAFPGLSDGGRAGREAPLAQAVAALRAAGAKPDLLMPALTLLRRDTPRGGWRELANRWADVAPKAIAAQGARGSETRRMREFAERVADLKHLPAERLESLLAYCRTLHTWPVETVTVEAALSHPYTAEVLHQHRESLAFERWLKRAEEACA